MARPNIGQLLQTAQSPGHMGRCSLSGLFQPQCYLRTLLANVHQEILILREGSHPGFGNQRKRGLFGIELRATAGTSWDFFGCHRDFSPAKDSVTMRVLLPAHGNKSPW